MFQEENSYFCIPGSELKKNVLSCQVADKLGSLPSDFGSWNVIHTLTCHLKRAGFACYNLVNCIH